jgi:RHS repeat-associated protein
MTRSLRYLSFLYRVVFLVLTSIFLSSSAHAQINNVGDDTSTPIEGVGHDYIKALSETVNPANGSVSLRIKVPTAKARGITLPFSFNYDSNGVNHIVSGFQPTPQSDLTNISQGGWSYGLPLLQGMIWTTETAGGSGPVTCTFNSGYTFQDPSGGRHNLGLATASYSSGGDGGTYLCSAPYINGGDQKYAASLVTTESAGNVTPSVIVSDADGTVYHFPNPGYGNQGCSGCYSSLPDYIEDRNGNQILGASGPEYLDTTGRSAISWNGLGSSGQTNTVTVSGMQYQVNWTSTTPNFTFSPNKVVSSVNGYYCEAFLPANTAETVVSTITLPNTQKYQFYYGTNNPNGYSNPYGLLSEIDYPTGAWVRYAWTMSSTYANDKYAQGVAFDGISATDGSEVPGYCQALYATPVLASRTVGIGSTTLQTQSFSYGTSWTSGGISWTSKQTTVSTTDNVRGLTSQTIYTYQPGNAGYNNPYNEQNWLPSQLTLEQTIQYYNWGNTSAPFRTVTKAWADIFDLSSENTTLQDVSPAVTSGTAYTYTSGILPQPKTETKYDYGMSTVLNETIWNYPSSQTVTPVGGTVANMPVSVITYDGNNNRYAERDYTYDSYAGGINSVTAANHDNTNFPTTYTARANVTTKTRQCFVGSDSCTNSSTTYGYDETGQVLSITDPCGNGTCSDMNGTGTSHTTSYSYADNYTVLSSGANVAYTVSGNPTNTYLTQVTDALGYKTSYVYDYNNGQLTNATDPNSESTTYLYNDPFARPRLVTYPDHGTTTLNYVDSSTPTVTTTQAVNSGTNITTISTADALGRLTTTEVSTDPDNPTYEATTYDGENRAYTTSNPYRSTSDSTYGITTKTYDALGRVTAVSEPDGSTVHTSYSGNQTMVTDEVGNQRTSTNDGLGRLTSVVEAPNVSGYGFTTVYAYDPLNDVVSVTQNGNNSANARNRSFIYDSFGRITSATNPESGTITYSYDLNSNISTKVSPKPDQLGNPQTTIDYYYDVNSRLYKKTYTNPDASTVEYGYDGSMISCGQNPPTISSPTNLIGRRSAMCAGLSGTSWSFDPMGRPLLETTITNGGGNQTKLSVQYSYNLDGSPNMITYPSGDVVTYTPGGAGRSLGVSDSSTAYVASGSNHATYSPNGAVTSMTNGYTGRFAGIVTTNVYNDRLQPLLLSASTPSSTLFQLCYDFHVGTAISNGPCQINQYTTGDNGNLYQVLNHSDSTRSAAYIYDPLNRIAQAYTVNTNSANCWGETYSSIATAPGVLPSPANLGIDPWGNLTNKSAVSGMGGGCATTSLSQTANTNNQLSGSTYDAAGNITNDGNGNQPTYDDEDRIVTDAGVTYSYDADGMRIEKSSGTKYWYGSGGEILAETSLAGTINEEYIYFAGQRIARVDRPSGTVHYYFSNHIGSHTMITSATGACEQDIDYFPYGGVVTDHCPNVSQRYKFTGKERDSESGLDNFGARYNASSMGRFMTPDPSNLSVDFWLPQTWNRYAYALNNPLAVVDRNGLWPWYIHNEIIDEAFPGLSKSQLQSLKTASANVDKDQSPAGSYKHGMGNGDAVNNTTTPGDTSDYIHQNEQTAEQVQADWIASGHTGIAPGAMTAFGNALHTVTDMTSPAHEGYQLWYGTWDFFGVTAAYHFLSESRISDARRNTAIAAARQTFMNTFGWMALQNATDGLTPKVTHKICYPDENGKQSCQ